MSHKFEPFKYSQAEYALDGPESMKLLDQFLDHFNDCLALFDRNPIWNSPFSSPKMLICESSTSLECALNFLRESRWFREL